MVFCSQSAPVIFIYTTGGMGWYIPDNVAFIQVLHNYCTIPRHKKPEN